MSIDYDAIMDKDYDEIQQLKARLAEEVQGRKDLMDELSSVVLRLAEAEGLLRVAHDCLYATAKSGWSEETRSRINAFLRSTVSAAVQPAVCECGHDCGQHSKGDPTWDYCRHCPCPEWRPADSAEVKRE